MIERHLRFFVVTAEEEHFQRAAARLSMTQSALSRRIQVLEEELGVELFERLPRGVRLSPAGTSFYRDVSNFKAKLEEAASRARNVAQGIVGRLTIALNPSAVRQPLLTRALQVFNERFPSVDIKLQVMFSEEQLSTIQDGDIDAGVIYKFSEDEWARYLLISNDELVIALPASNPIASKADLSLKDLATSKFIWPARGYSPRMYDRMIAACHAQGFSPNIMTEVRSAEAVLDMVSIGLAVGFVNSHEIETAPPSVVVRRIADLNILLPLCLTWSETHVQPALASFISVLKEIMEEAGGSTAAD